MNKWDKIRSECKVRELCDCEQNFLCEHPDNSDSNLCDKESCPLLKGNINA